jgi:hypothetical protein
MRLVASILALSLTSCAIASAETYVVSPDGSGDFPTIQTAIDAVVDGDIVQLTDGVFTGEGNRDLDLLGKAIAIESQSGNPAVCVLDCQGSATEPHRGFCFRSGEGPGSVVGALTIANGYVAGDDGGAGILCLDDSSPTLRNCVFDRNTSGSGAGGAVFALFSSPLVTGCIFIENSAAAGGGIACSYSAAVLRDCEFRRNSATYGGALICCQAPGPHVEHCTFHDNSAEVGGAVYS